MGYSQGVGGEGQLFPLSEHRSPLSTAQFSSAHKVFYRPGSLHQSLPPLDTSSERVMVFGPETGYKEFSADEVQLFRTVIVA